MMGQVGNDGDGQGYISYLQKEEKIDISGVKVLEDVPTGQAFILSQADGDNSIVINGGANMAFTDFEMSQQWKDAIQESDVLLLQREIPDLVNI